MKYSELLKVQATSAWHVWSDCSEVTCDYTAIAWGWYVEAFFSDTSMQRYDEIGKCLGYLMALAIASGMIARVVLQDKVDVYVAECLDEEALRVDAIAEVTFDEADKVTALGPKAPVFSLAKAPISIETIEWVRRTLKNDAYPLRTLKSFIQQVQQQDQLRYGGAQPSGRFSQKPSQVINS